MKSNLEEARKNFLLYEENLSALATKSNKAIRLNKEESDIRTPFSRDTDRIINSLSYTRYLDKTQVFSYKENDHISKRMTHVQLVSKIARTIGRALNLNTDLIEAIALGHDIGHTPLGHTGESILNEISKRELGEYFAHNIQSVRELMIVENNGKGLNLTIQVLDGIMCHNGEILSSKYEPVSKTEKDVLENYNLAYKDLQLVNKIPPMTLEGCIVRISDIIGYIGRDIEDAINIGVLKKEDLPKQITEILGSTNKEIINTIILDIIDNSMNKPYLKLSDDVYNAILLLKKFNYQNIYSKSLTKEEIEYYRLGMNNLYSKYLNDIINQNKNSIIFKIFLDSQDKSYLEKTSDKRKVIDFISGMTDDFFKEEIERLN